MREFQVNDYITIKLENKKPVIYINKERILQCSYLLLDIKHDEIKSFDEIESIDEAEARINISELTRDIEIPPETQFWVQCSNLQVWAENNYDTRLLHRNVAFPLLRKLSEVGDKIAIEVFQKEIIKRIECNFKPVSQFLIECGYLRYINDENMKYLLSREDLKLLNLILERISETSVGHYFFNRLNYVSKTQFDEIVLPWFNLLDNEKKFSLIRGDCLENINERIRNQLINQNLMDSFFESIDRKGSFRDHIKIDAIEAIKKIAKFLPENFKNDITNFLLNLDYREFSDLIGGNILESGLFDYLNQEQKIKVFDILRANLIKWYSSSLKNKDSSERDIATYNFTRLAKFLPEDLKKSVLNWIKTNSFEDLCFIINNGALDFLPENEIKDFLKDPQLKIIQRLNETIKTEKYWYYALETFSKLSKNFPINVKNEAVDWLKNLNFNNFLFIVDKDFLSFLNQNEIGDLIKNPNFDLVDQLINLLEKEDSRLGVNFLVNFRDYLSGEDKNKLIKWIKKLSVDKITFLLGNNLEQLLSKEEFELLINSIANDLFIDLLNKTTYQNFETRQNAINGLKQIGNSFPLIFITAFEKNFRTADLTLFTKVLKSNVLNYLDKDKLKKIVDDPRSQFVELLFLILENEDIDSKKDAVIGFRIFDEFGIKMVYNKMDLLSENKKITLIYNLFEGGYFAYEEDFPLLKKFMERLRRDFNLNILTFIINIFMEKWKKQDYEVNYLFDSEIFKTLTLLNEFKEDFIEESIALKTEIKKLIDKKIVPLTLLLYLEDFLEDLTIRELTDMFSAFNIKDISKVFNDLFKSSTDYEKNEWMLSKFERLGDIGFKLFENLIDEDIEWEIKENFLYLIKKYRGLEYFKNYVLKLLDKGNQEAIKILLYSELGYDIKTKEQIALFEQSNKNILEIFAKAIKENEYLVESYFNFFYERESEINKALIPLLKKSIVRSFKEKNLNAILLLIQFDLIFCFSRNELIELLKNSELEIIKTLLVTSTYPSLINDKYIHSPKDIIKYFFSTLFDEYSYLLKKDLINVLKSNNLEFLQLFVKYSCYGRLKDYERFHLYEYLDNYDYTILFNETKSSFKNNLIEILKNEQENVENYLKTINFLIWIKVEIGEQYVNDLIDSFKKNYNDLFNINFSKILKYLSGPITAPKLKTFVETYYIPFKRDRPGVIDYVEIHGEKFYIIDEILDLNASNLGLFHTKKIKQISEIKGLEKFKNLKGLKLDSQSITEIDGLHYLENLEFLSFRNNLTLTEIKGLDNLTQLKTLYLDGNRIPEIKGLDGLKNLEVLWLDHNKISQIKGLDNLKNLKELSLGSNKIKKIEGLESLKNLKSLIFWGNQISVIENLTHLKELETLDLNYNKINEISGLEGLNKLKKLKMHQESTFIPENLIEKLGGIKDGVANDPQKFVEYCEKIKKA